MPCRSDYPPITKLEVELIKIFNINDFLDGKTGSYNSYHPKGYQQNLTYEDLDRETEKLCTRLQTVSNIYDYPVYVGNWWMEHREVDFKRLVVEKSFCADENAFISALSDFEKELLTTNNFLEEIIDREVRDYKKRMKRFDEQKTEDVKNRMIRYNFCRVFYGFEHFCELAYFREKPNMFLRDCPFKFFEESTKLLKEITNESYNNWLSEDDILKLKSHFEKYFLISGIHKQGNVQYFDPKQMTQFEIDQRTPIKEEISDLIRIILILENRISAIL